MSYYRDQVLKAKKTAEAVNLLKKNNYMTNMLNDNILFTREQSFIPQIYNWYKIEGYRSKENENETRLALNAASYGLLRSASTNCSVFLLDCVDGKKQIFYGTGNNNDLSSIFSASVPECIIHKNVWDGHSYEYNGILTGSITSTGFADVFCRLKANDCYAACITVPTNDDEAVKKFMQNEELIHYLEQFKTQQRTYGSLTKRIEEIPIQEIIDAINTLKIENQFLTANAGKGFCRSCIRFGAIDQETYNHLKTVLRSSMRNDVNSEKNDSEPIRIFNINGATGKSDCLAVPRVNIVNPVFHGSVDLISWQALGTLSEFTTMPINSYNGFYVRNTVTDNTLDIFPETPPLKSNKNIVIGSPMNSTNELIIPYSALSSHMFITGATRTGKTTTTKRIVTELASIGIPSLIIEAAKKEYIDLITEIPHLRVYTPGNDGDQLFINPLQIEDGTLVENHIDAVVRAITASTEGEHPIPEALEGLLKKTYKNAGWEYGMLAYSDMNKPFPTFKDVYNNIPEYINTHARYGPEVKSNLEGALSVRIENLYSGALGKCFSKPYGFTAKDLLENPTILELADFSSTGTEFLMNILLYKLHCYTSRLGVSDKLERVIVVEEAHNVFRKTELEEGGRARNNEYFEKMLAEIAASGTSIIICDQRPSIMADSVIANTSVKICHGLSEKNDLDIMASSLNLSETQSERIRELKKGTCLIGIRGEYGVQYGQINRLETNISKNKNPACHICYNKLNCKKTALQKLLKSMDTQKLRYHISKIQTNIYNPKVLISNIECMLNDLNIKEQLDDEKNCCLLGCLLEQYATISYQESRILVNTYKKYLKGVY